MTSGQQTSRDSSAFPAGTTSCTSTLHHLDEHALQFARLEGVSSRDHSFQFRACDSATSVEHSTEVPTCNNVCQCSNRVALVFSHLEPIQGEDSGVNRCTCNQGCAVGQHQGDENCIHKHSATAMVDPETVEELNSETESLADSLKTLSVSMADSRSVLSRGTTNAPSSHHMVPPQAHYSGHYGNGGCGSCREEALCVGHMDDVTVDELAGYFDQLLYLPRPMSEMAQLMYT